MRSKFFCVSLLAVSLVLPDIEMSTAFSATAGVTETSAATATDFSAIRRGGGARRTVAVRGRHGGGAARRTTVARGPRGGAVARRTTVVGRPGAHGGGVRRAAVVRPGWHGGGVRRTTVVRPGWHGGGVRWARPGNYWWRPGGAIAAGAALGFVTAATAVAWAGAAPAADMCWYYTDPSRTQGFWDACP